MHSDDIYAYLERTITERHLAGDKRDYSNFRPPVAP